MAAVVAARSSMARAWSRWTATAKIDAAVPRAMTTAMVIHVSSLCRPGDLSRGVAP